MTNPERNVGASRGQSRGKLRVLIVEDSTRDAELVERQLTKAGWELCSLCVVGAGAFAEALASGDWNVIIADYAVPGSANARDAMPRGGNLTIELHRVELDEAYTRRHASMTPGRYAMLAVSDTGMGMDAETAAHLFEPFFTTKSTGKGTGLGLATVYGIVKQCEGDIWVYSEPGVGSIFKVHLPHCAEEVELRAPIQREPEVLSGNETILLVEDSQGLRQLTRELLSVRGYLVLEAADGLEALELSRSYEDPIHLLVTDIVMPRIRGTEVAVQIAEQRPGIGVVFLSGYTEQAMSHVAGATRIAILEKPYTVESLLRTIRKALDDTQIAA